MSVLRYLRLAAHSDLSWARVSTLRLWRGPGRERDLLTQVVKATGAAVLAWVIAGWWWSAPMALLAPWTAVLLVQATVYSSIIKGLQQLVVITVATLLASGALIVLDSTLAAMAVALPITLVLSNWARFGDQGVYGPTTALFVICYGAVSPPMVGHRLLESAVGAAIGIGVNALILPPVHLRSSREGLRGLGREVRDILRDVAAGVTEPWDQGAISGWHARAEQLPRRLDGVRKSMEKRRRSLRLNPSGSPRSPFLSGQVRGVWRLPDDTTVLHALRHVVTHVNGITRTLADAANDDIQQDVFVPEVVDPYAEFLREIGVACDTCTQMVTSDPDGRISRRLQQAITRAQSLHDALSRQLPQLPLDDPRVTAVFGALLMDGQHLIDHLSKTHEPAAAAPV